MNFVFKGLVIPFFIILSLVLVGCAVKPTYVDPPSTEAGFIVGTIGKKTYGDHLSKHVYSNLVFRKLGSEETHVISYEENTIIPPKDGEITLEDKAYDSFSVALLPGDYEIFRVSFTAPAGLGTIDYEAKENFSMPFKVEKGVSTYLGEFTSFGTKGKNIFGLNVTNGGFFGYSAAKQERDLPLIFSKHPKVSKKIRSENLSEFANEYIIKIEDIEMSE